ncbi:MAG: 6,7-dimethyl-8-ribityllumazine synthase [Fibrobacteria bacterium]|nr:6,7-dimethyl-8-ribityllumazine synthase [Fibrobacteria bacterium]
MKSIEGKLKANSKKFAIVVSRFNEFITNKLLGGCEDCLVRHGADTKDLTTVWVPGAFEIPQTVKVLIKSGKYDGVIALGAVIRGGTPHFDYVAGSVSRGLAECALNSSIPVSFGVLTTDTIEQAVERAGTKAGNKGWDAAMSALEMSNVLDQIS